MKLTSKTAIIALALGAMAFSAEALRPDWINYEKYAESNKEIKALPADKNRVVFFGNSITELWPMRSAAFFTDNGFIGRGISGQTTYQFLSRFREDVVELHPALVVINAATNDVAENSHKYDAEKTMGNIKSMVEIAKANNIKVILTSTLPCSSFGWNTEITDAPEKIADLNDRIKAYAKEQKIPYVDYYSSMLADDGRSLRPEYTNDGVHPVAEGYAVMESLILPAIKKALKKK